MRSVYLDGCGSVNIWVSTYNLFYLGMYEWIFSDVIQLRGGLSQLLLGNSGL